MRSLILLSSNSVDQDVLISSFKTSSPAQASGVYGVLLSSALFSTLLDGADLALPATDFVTSPVAVQFLLNPHQITSFYCL